MAKHRIDQFAVFSGQLPPELDEVANRWNREAETMASEINRGELKPVAEQLQRFRLIVGKGRP